MRRTQIATKVAEDDRYEYSPEEIDSLADERFWQYDDVVADLVTETQHLGMSEAWDIFLREFRGRMSEDFGGLELKELYDKFYKMRKKFGVETKPFQGPVRYQKH